MPTPFPLPPLFGGAANSPMSPGPPNPPPRSPRPRPLTRPPAGQRWAAGAPLRCAAAQPATPIAPRGCASPKHRELVAALPLVPPPRDATVCDWRATLLRLPIAPAAAPPGWRFKPQQPLDAHRSRLLLPNCTGGGTTCLTASSPGPNLGPFFAISLADLQEAEQPPLALEA